MAVLLSPVGGAAAQFLDNNGNPLLAGKLFTYVAGTTTNQATYTSSSGTTPHTNPIILDAGGRVPGGEIWLTDGLQYKFVLKTSTDVLIGTYDNLVGINSNFVNFLTETEVQTATAGQTVFTLTTMQYQQGTNNLSVFVDGVNQIDGATYSYVETSPTVITFTAGLHVGALVKFTTAQTLSTGVTDASLVTYTPPFTASVATTVEDKLAQTISVQDFGAVGNGVTNDTTALANAIAACPVGGTLQGHGLTYSATNVTINKAITVEGVNVLLAANGTAAQDAFTITSNDVTLLNCGATITQAALPLSNTSAGVYSDGYDRIVIDGGLWDGSIDNIYAPGFYRGVIFIKDGEDCVVRNTTTQNAGGEGLWIFTCTRPQVLNNFCYNAGGSELVCGVVESGIVQGNTLVGNAVAGNSGMAIGGNILCDSNTVINASGWGISYGEGAGSGFRAQITNNFISGHGNYLTATNFAGINVISGEGIIVSGNRILAPTVGALAYGIQLYATPSLGNVICENNYVEDSTLQGIFVSGDLTTDAIISGNIIKNTVASSILTQNVKTLTISNNHLLNTKVAAAVVGEFISIANSGTPELISITGNYAKSDVQTYTTAVYLVNNWSSATQYVHRDNAFLTWTTEPFTTGRACNYDIRGDNYGIAPRSGLVTLTNGGTTTTVTSTQVSAQSVIQLELGNAAASALNPVYRISTLSNGSFVITHTAGTAAGQQLKWTII